MGHLSLRWLRGMSRSRVGLMVILAESSAIIAPLLLRFLIPIVAGDVPLRTDVVKMAGTLLGAQLLPLCMGF
jgi:bile acid:Na+ symporter, BASS family